MPSLPETFRDPASRVSKVIVVIDLVNSTAMKEVQPEATWLTTYGWFFDLLRHTIASHKGKIVKYLGDGALAVFSEDDAADAINWAIEVQERVADAQAQNRIACDCSAGLSSGEVIEFDSPDNARDYIGLVVDKAFRLSSAANAKAVFVDTDTISAAAMNKVQSRTGASTAPKRKVADYQGREESVPLKGFSSPVSYYEILWASSRYGVSPPFVTKLSAPASAAATPLPSVPRREAPPSTAAEWLRGKVKTIRDEFGFARATTSGEEFWFNQAHLFNELDQLSDLAIGDDVWFSPLAPVGNAKARRAGDVIKLGTSVVGRLERVRPEGYGFVAITTRTGKTKELFVFLGDASKWTPGMQVEFTIGENPRGIAGEDPHEVED